jgi:hypothetical protein
MLARVATMRPEEARSLLSGEARARLPLRRQVLLYLDPFALFMDASVGPRQARERALRYNRSMRWMLVAYLRRWSAIAAVLYGGIFPSEALAAQSPLFLIPTAAIAAACCIALTVVAVISAVYLLLGWRGRPHH